jgi:PTH1 family peptidyl-tRNA hydrolase
VRRHHLDWTPQSRFKAIVAAGSFNGEKVFFLKPVTYMNVSGDAVQPFAAFYNIAPSRVLVVCDDVNLPWGKVRVRSGGSDGGQKGLRDIIQRLGTQEIPRLRLGCAPERPGGDLATYVLSPIWGEARTVVELVRETAADCVETVVSEGLIPAMTKFNGWDAFPKEAK